MATKPKTGPKDPATGPATSGDVAGQLPPRKKEYRYGWAVDIAALPPDEQLAAQVRRNKWISDHPDTKARMKIESHLQAAHLDSVVQQSPELSRFVWLMRDLLHKHHPGETLEHILLPLQTLMARHGGGRPKNAETWAEWKRRFDLKRRNHPMVTAPELYGDVAAEWAEEGHQPVKWTAIRNGLSKLKKLPQ